MPLLPAAMAIMLDSRVGPVLCAVDSSFPQRRIWTTKAEVRIGDTSKWNVRAAPAISFCATASQPRTISN
jgi:hypothetical protein